MITEAFTLARNFGPWFGGVALAAALAGGGAAWWLAGGLLGVGVVKRGFTNSGRQQP